MNPHTFFQYFQLFFSIGLASLIVFRIRKPLRAMIVQMMPVKKRVSDDFFHIQTRIGLIVGIVLALIIATLVYLGLETVEHRFAEPTVEQTFVPTSTTELLQPVGEPPEEEPIAEEPTSSDGEYNNVQTETMPKDHKQETPTPKPAMAPKGYNEETGDFFLQLHAYQNYDYALLQFEHLGKKLDRQVWLARIDGEAVPHKLVVGPFPSRSALRRYQSQQGLDGWVRKRTELRLERRY